MMKAVGYTIGAAAGFSALAMLSNVIAHGKEFSRADYSEYDTDRFITYEDLNCKKYPREAIAIQSGKNKLNGFLYGIENTRGLVVISPGHRNCNDIKLYETIYFVNAGWQVFCYDYTGGYTSEGKNMSGYTQSVHDLDAVLTYIERTERFAGMPVVLFGHSLGAYATGAVLRYGHNVRAAVVASAFDSPVEQWSYSIERFTGIAHYLLCPYARMYARLKYGADAKLTAVAGINSVDIPVLVMSGTWDIYYGGESPVYAKRDKITNQNCRFRLEDREGHSNHYDYFLTDESIAYAQKVDSGEAGISIDKRRYQELDMQNMDEINSFLEAAVRNNGK